MEWQQAERYRRMQPRSDAPAVIDAEDMQRHQEQVQRREQLNQAHNAYQSALQQIALAERDIEVAQRALAGRKAVLKTRQDAAQVWKTRIAELEGEAQ